MTTLWRQPDFLRLWGGQTVSLFGSQVSQLAIPLTAVLVLHAGPAELGVLGALQFAPFVLVSLVAGVTVDRGARRPLLIAADVGRAVMLGSIPLAALAGVLGLTQLFVVAFLSGFCTVFFDVAYQAYLPSLVRSEQLVEANSKLTATRSIAEATGTGIGGILVQAIGAPFAVAADALSFVVSVLSLLFIRAPEPAPTGVRRQMVAEVREGLAVVLRNPILRGITACTATSNLFGSAFMAVFLLYAVRRGLSPAALGLVLAAGGPAAFLGSVIAALVTRVAGIGPTLVAAMLTGTAGSVLMAIADGPLELVEATMAVGFALVSLAGAIYNIDQVSLRQTIVPGRLQGRMNATVRFLIWGTIPIGSLLGGFAGALFGLSPTLLFMASAGILAVIPLLITPVRQLRVQPPPLA